MSAVELLPYGLLQCLQLRPCHQFQIQPQRVPQCTCCAIHRDTLYAIISDTSDTRRTIPHASTIQADTYAYGMSQDELPIKVARPMRWEAQFQGQRGPQRRPLEHKKAAFRLTSPPSASSTVIIPGLPELAIRLNNIQGETITKLEARLWMNPSATEFTAFGRSTIGLHRPKQRQQGASSATAVTAFGYVVAISPSTIGHYRQPQQCPVRHKTTALGYVVAISPSIIGPHRGWQPQQCAPSARLKSRIPTLYTKLVNQGYGSASARRISIRGVLFESWCRIPSATDGTPGCVCGVVLSSGLIIFGTPYRRHGCDAGFAGRACPDGSEVWDTISTRSNHVAPRAAEANFCVHEVFMSWDMRTEEPKSHGSPWDSTEIGSRNKVTPPVPSARMKSRIPTLYTKLVTKGYSSASASTITIRGALFWSWWRAPSATDEFARRVLKCGTLLFVHVLVEVLHWCFIPRASPFPLQPAQQACGQLGPRGRTFAYKRACGRKSESLVQKEDGIALIDTWGESELEDGPALIVLTQYNNYTINTWVLVTSKY
ncbi:hypothetical protein BC832DRAFT_541786 [Gaertneriomyces semiglobifer]|nr:hypothetical protein BC832DRAFT_541786 [Gaertneriomyces semiglobifer]